MKPTPRASIVLGTYNRKDILRDCLEAVRQSVGDVSYEIIIVDGGSTDGTLPWLRQQPDVVTIEQRRLVGACRAYNAGFRLARAPLVIHVNDDDVVLDDTIARSVEYMEQHPDVGQGAYAFDLWSPGHYRFDHVFGKVYANKGITRRELGDRAGWWPELFYTYAGDTELSCRIWEMGYKVVPLEHCRAHDLQTQDELRRVNNPEGHNPDSQAFYEFRDSIDNCRSYPERRVLHVALNTSTDRQPALERALRSMGEYRQIDWKRTSDPDKTIKETCDQWSPTLVFMQLQTPGVVTPGLARSIKAPGRVVVNWSGDVRDPMPGWYAKLGVDVNLTLFTNDDWVDSLCKAGLNADYLQIGFNQEIYHPWGPSAKTEDVVFLANHYGNMFPLSEERLAIAKLLMKRGVGIYGTGWPFPTQPMTDHHREVEVYRGCKIAVGMSQMDLERYTSDRLFRAMGSEAFYLARWYPGIERDYEQGVHLDWWRDQAELLTKIDYYQKHAEVRESVARAGCELVHSRHTWLDQVYKLTNLIGWHPWK